MTLLLLDECLSPRLTAELGTIECQSVISLGWAVPPDPEVLARARGPFEAVLTTDRRFIRREDRSGDDPAVLLLRPRRSFLPYLIELVPKIEAVLTNLQLGTISEVR